MKSRGVRHLLRYCRRHYRAGVGRVRKEERWGPRTLDIDILLFGNDVIDPPRLAVPHYGLTKREFVVYPLFEIAPTLVLPNNQSLADITKTLPLNDLQQLPQQ